MNEQVELDHIEDEEADRQIRYAEWLQQETWSVQHDRGLKFIDGVLTGAGIVVVAALVMIVLGLIR